MPHLRGARLPLNVLALIALLCAYAAPRAQEGSAHEEAVPRVVDPLLEDQWHLKARGLEVAGANVRAQWPTTTGTGVVIGIVDDGLQHTHPDLQPNYQSSASYDFNFDDADPSPSTAGSCSTTANCHGTAAAGVAGARDDNGLGGAGSAPRASLAGLRLIAAGTTDLQDASALGYLPDAIHISSNSWGPSDNGSTLAGPGALTYAAMQSAATSGRGGKGRIFVWAGGNGRANDDNCNFDGYANSRFVIAVGALADNGQQAFYSESCSALMVSAASNGGIRGITTTDLIGAAGYDAADDYTNSFGGTSSATPLVAGSVALMLARNPNLTRRDVQHILRQSSFRLNPGDAGWTTGAFPHNEKYGFGQLDAHAAAELASTWTNVPGEATPLSPATRTVDLAVPDNVPAGVSDTITISSAESDFIIEHIELDFTAAHTWRGDLQVTLTSPAGTVSTLAPERPFDSGDNFSGWRFGSARHWGESPAGLWTLNVADLVAMDIGTWNSWTLRVYGYRTAVSAPTITLQPTNQSVAAGGNATFTATANGNPGPTFQWQVSTNGGTAWTDLANTLPYSGVTTATLTITGAGLSLSGNQYRAVATNSEGAAPSNGATLTVTIAPPDFIVNSTLDAVDAAIGNGVCATAGGVCTLRAAIQEANALSGAKVIALPAGTYSLTIAGREEFSAATGDLNIGPNGITINGAASASTIINANGIDRAFQSFDGSLTLNDLTVQNGNPLNATGGCLYFSSTQLTLNRAVVTNCNSGTSSGGGIIVFGSTLTLTDATIAGNATTSSGGGIYISANTTATISRTTISGNSASDGAGILLFGFDGSPSTLTLANTTISGNTATSWGGAMYVSGATGSAVTLTNVTIASNSSGGVGGVVVSGVGQYQVKNTIIANGAGAAPANCFVISGGVVTDLGNNLEFPGTACGFGLPSDVRANPLLGGLTNNGGPTRTHPLAWGSPAVRAGNTAACAAAPVAGVDQRGVARPAGACAIGAYEFAIAPTVPISNGESDADGDGKAEIAIFRPSSGTWFILSSSTGYVASASREWGLSTDVPVPGDYDGDGLMDLAVYRPSTGGWEILQSTNNATATYTLGLGGDLAVPGDYDGDGRTDPAVYRQATGTWYILTSSSNHATTVTFQWGLRGDVPVPADYDGDEEIDIAVYRPLTGTWYVLTSSSGHTTHLQFQWGLNGDVPVPGDYDGDRVTDFAVYRPALGLWFILQSTGNFATSAAYQWGLSGDVPVPSDYDGDGKADLAVYRPSTGTWYIAQSTTGYTTSVSFQWGLSGDTPTPNAPLAHALATRSTLATLVRASDFDADRKADLTVYRPSTGTWFSRRSSAGYGTSTERQWGLTDDLPAPHDYDGDGQTDFSVFRPSTGTWYILRSSSNNTASTQIQWGLMGDLPVPGDYDGDGVSDLMVFRPSTGVWHLLHSSTNFTTSASYQWGLSGDVPVPGDYDGDASTDLAVYRPSTGEWFIRHSTTNYATAASFQWGLPGDIAVPGEYDGDAKTDLAVYRPSTGEWFIRQSSTGYTTSTSHQWGLNEDVPVPSDFDGDRKTDLAVWRPSTGVWYLLRSSTNLTVFDAVQWGLSGDTPILRRP